MNFISLTWKFKVILKRFDNTDFTALAVKNACLLCQLMTDAKNDFWEYSLFCSHQVPEKQWIF